MKPSRLRFRISSRTSFRICGGGLRVERVGEFALEAGGRVLRHAVGAVLSPLGERQLTERVLADAVEVPAPETAVIMISAEYGYGYGYGVEGGVEEGFGSHAYAHARTGYGYGFFFPFFFFFIGGVGGKVSFSFFPSLCITSAADRGLPGGGGLRLGLRVVPK